MPAAPGQTRVAILISGTGSNMVALAEAMAAPDLPARPVVVVSNMPGAAGLEKAAARRIPTEVVDHRGRPRAAFEADLAAALARHGPELICLAGFMRILSPGFVARWPGRILNIHPSLLPAYPGLDTHARALADGVAEHGCTVHEVTAALDAGPILGQARVPVRSGDTVDSLAARVQAAEHRLYPAVLRARLTGGAVPVLLH